MRPLLVGEDNPYSTDSRYALYPEPRNSAGGRLCRLIMQLSKKDYIRGFERVNLCEGKWSVTEASRRATELAGLDGASRTLVLLGKKVCDAFGVNYLPFSWLSTARTVVLPHPSARNRAWNDLFSFERARQTLRDAGVLPLPPWPPKKCPRKAKGEWLELLPSTDASTERPAWCSNCHLILQGAECPDCGPQ